MHTTQDEPVAVIGLACRFAGGADTPGRFWDMLVSGRHGIGPLPEQRWREYAERGGAHTAAVRRASVPGGYLDDISGFDSAFFGLSPREAELMDPQQRLLLELSWEALEQAGVAPGDLAGGDTGVFVGVGSDDYGRRLLEDLPGIEAWTGIGSAMCAVANRISYALDLRGPSLAVDTACSASLVATHLACQSLRAGESGIALVGGVNLVIAPGLNLTLNAAGATAPDGRSKPFSDQANGYGRGEGGGVLVLKRLADAVRDGDQVLSVIRGSSVQQDGRTNGIMAPNGAAQRVLIEDACRRAGVSPAAVGYVEAHGTGTPVGDPLEAGALSAVYGRDRAEPCLVGSVKSNIGHLEAGAGVAALIKATLALVHEEIPPSLGYGEGNPAIDWPRSGLKVVIKRTPWRRGDRPRLAAVSGFGYGGTIGHVVLEEAPLADAADASEPAGRVFPLSAASEKALREYAGALADSLTGDEPLASLGHTLARRRTHLSRRAAIVATDHDDLRAGLRVVAAGEQSREATTGQVVADGVVWVFSGHGSQWTGMGRELLDAEPEFARAVEELEPIFLEEIGFSPRQVLRDGDFPTVDRIQTMIFVMQVGLAAVWRSRGVTPAAVIGHSVGEIAAAVAAGALTPQDGARLICRRSALLRRVAGSGAMAMVGLPFDEVTARLDGRTDVVPAIWSSPSSTVVSGDPAAVDELVERWGAEDVSVRRVASDVAFHSPQMDPLLTYLAPAVADLTSASPRIPLYSTVLSDPRAMGAPDGAYWAANLRQPVRLAAATLAAAEDGHRAFLEISAHPVVAHSIRETLSEHGFSDSFVGSTLRRDQPECHTLLTSFAAAHCHGVRVTWPQEGGLVSLPQVAWQRTAHWHELSSPAGAASRGHDTDSHTLLGGQTELAGGSILLWQTVLDEAAKPYPGSHTINGVEVVPAAVLISTFLGTGGSAVDSVALRLPLVVGDRQEIQVVRDGDALRLASRAPGGEWLTCCTATAAAGTADALEVPDGLAPADPGHVTRHLASVGVPSMGFDWTITDLSRAENALRARIEIPDTSTWAAVLDAALSVAPTAFAGPPELRMVAGVDQVWTGSAPPPVADVIVVVRDGVAEVSVSDVDGQLRLRLNGLRYGGVGTARRDLVHEIAWRPLELVAAARRDLLVIGDSPLAEAVVRHVPGSRIAEIEEAGPDTDVLVLPEKSGDVPEDAVRATWRLTDLMHRLPEGARLWCVTTGVRESTVPGHLAQAPLWGLGRVLAGEHHDEWGGVIDLPGDDRETALRLLPTVLAAAPGEDIVSVRDGQAFAARLRPVSPTGGETLTCRPDGTYLITGGLGVLGLQVARHLAERGARRLVLASRSTLRRADWPAELHRLEATGVTVKTIALDVTDAANIAATLEALDLPPVRGIVHAAGVLDNRMVRKVDEDSVRTVLAPKVAGAWALHTAFPPGSLDFLVLFSSCGQLLGLPGQATYGAANAFLDALAAHRDDTTSLAWTSWRGQGMAADEAVDRELTARGVTDITPDEAFRAWDLASRNGTGHYVVLGVTDKADERLPVLDELTPAVVEEPAAVSFTDLSPDELRTALLAEIGAQIAGEMRLPATSLDPRRSLIEQGLDSVMTITVRRGLEKRFGHKLPTTLLWHKPSVSAITDHLVGVLTA